jgi:2-iminobutanoate/2-iminopropanoate deaminase
VHKKIVSTQSAPAPIGPYSQGVIAGGLLFVSGQIAIDPASGQFVGGDVESQAEQALKNVLAVLREAKVGPENVVKSTIFLSSMSDFPRVNAVYERTFGKEPPARSTVAVSGLPKDALVEIEVVAAF